MQRVLRLFLLTVVSASLLTGCASTHMKGTPFYTGEYETRRGDAADRVNLWPLLYYRDPALSILWPIGEVTDTHLALRPLFSVYDRDTADPTYKVLWPLATYAPGQDYWRVGVVGSGRDSFVAFPLYWHFGNPYTEGGSGTDALLPLWHYNREGEYSDLHIVWPLINVRNEAGSQGWRIWPLLGDYTEGERHDFYYLWPLGRNWSEGAEDAEDRRVGSFLLPLYAQMTGQDEAYFMALIYGAGYDDDSAWRYVLPLFAQARDPESEAFYSLLFSAGRDDDGEAAWNWLLPLWYRSTDADSGMLQTALGGYSRGPDQLNWWALPLLGKGTHSEERTDAWALLGLAHYDRDAEGGRRHHVLPFYGAHKNAQNERFLSLLWSHGKNHVEESSWRMLLPLFYNSTDGADATTITPLLAWGAEDQGQTRWRSVVPLLYYDRETEDGRLLATLLGGYKRNGDRSSWLFTPLLSGGSQSPEGSEFWGLGPMVHNKRVGDERQFHILPLYAYDSTTDMHLSLPFASWTAAEAEYDAIPPLLSWARTERDGDQIVRDYYLLAGLGHAEVDDEGVDDAHLFPLAYYDRDEMWLTPLVGHKFGDQGFTYWATPLAGTYTGKRSGFWLFPLGSRMKTPDGRVRGRMLWGSYTKSETHTRNGIWPLWGYRRHRPDPDRPVDQGWADSTSFWSLPCVWYSRSESYDAGATAAEPKYTARSNGVFPLWNYRNSTHDNGRHRAKGSLLLALYDYERKSMSAHQHGETARTAYDYERRRILWRLWHYERDHVSDTTSVDIFPGITYDRRTEDYKKFSVLWRLFRYERDEDETKLDLLFIPLKR